MVEKHQEESECPGAGLSSAGDVPCGLEQVGVSLCRK